MQARPTQVFIVDDSASVRMRLAQLLGSTHDISIVGEAGTAAEAVTGILQSHPDSVLLDLNLTGSTGLDVMRQVRPQAPDVVFVVLTNHDEPQYREACFRAGARYFLDKSRDLEGVAALIAQIGMTHQ